jgi:hypothetical protein
MKRISRNLLLVLMTGLLPLSMAFGQEKKNEQKVKIVIDDQAGTKTVIDTTFTAGSMPDSITLDNGKVIYFEKPETGTTHIRVDDGKGNIYVTCTADNDGVKISGGKIIIMSGDEGEWTVTPSTGTTHHVYVQANADSKDGKTEKHVIVTSAGDKDAVWKEADGNKVIIIKDGKALKEGEDGETFNIKVESNDVDTDADITKYVIAKDGVVVTVESNDEAKAKEIIKEIESKLDVKADAEGDKVVVKTETKKVVKK